MQNKIQKIMEVADKGGYLYKEWYKYDIFNHGYSHDDLCFKKIEEKPDKDNIKIFVRLTKFNEIVLDKMFWQALGKEKGWCGGKESHGSELCSDCDWPQCTTNFYVYSQEFFEIVIGDSLESAVDWLYELVVG